MLSLREGQLIKAALSLGASDAAVIVRHIMPSVVAPPAFVVDEAVLGFLGVGAVADEAV